MIYVVSTVLSILRSFICIHTRILLQNKLTRTRAAREGNGFLALTARTVAEAATRAAISDVYKSIVKI